MPARTAAPECLAHDAHKRGKEFEKPVPARTTQRLRRLRDAWPVSISSPNVIARRAALPSPHNAVRALQFIGATVGQNRQRRIERSPFFVCSRPTG